MTTSMLLVHANGQRIHDHTMITSMLPMRASCQNILARTTMMPTSVPENKTAFEIRAPPDAVRTKCGELFEQSLRGCFVPEFSSESQLRLPLHAVSVRAGMRTSCHILPTVGNMLWSCSWSCWVHKGLFLAWVLFSQSCHQLARTVGTLCLMECRLNAC